MPQIYSVLALVSGGKDSIFALQLCQTHGHRITALGNLTPEDQHVEELDSHCFQTVSHSMINLYPQLIDENIPVFRRKLIGRSVHTDLSYPERGVETDEIEDLRALIQFAKERVKVDAVCSGAILSDYQRLRVERICFELNLVSMSYLWKQTPQKRLLEDILNVGRIEAVLVKTAAMGLDPRKHLGKTLAEVKEDLIRIEEEYGSHSCGEGGEFESLVLDAPFFTRGRLRIEESEVVETSADRFARSGHLKILRVSVKKKGKEKRSKEKEKRRGRRKGGEGKEKRRGKKKGREGRKKRKRFLISQQVGPQLPLGSMPSAHGGSTTFLEGPSGRIQKKLGCSHVSDGQKGAPPETGVRFWALLSKSIGRKNSSKFR